MECPICKVGVQKKSLRLHMRHLHKKEMEEVCGEVGEEAEGVFVCQLAKGTKERGDCPVPGCGVTITSRSGMRRHFVARHECATVTFPGEKPLTECPDCGMKVPSLGRHRGKEMCRKTIERKKKREQEAAAKAADTMEFEVDGKKLEKVDSFVYLGRLLGANEDDSWLAISNNLQKARKRWGMVARVLTRQGATPQVMGYFYKAIVQAVLLYASETWVMTDRLWIALNTFHHKVARYITGDHIRLMSNGEWILPSSEDVLERTGLFTMEEYVNRRKETILPFVKRRPIYVTCLNSTRASTNVAQKVWWD